MTKYRTIRIPESLVKSVEVIIEKRQDLGYRSRSEFVIDAIRRRVETLLNSNHKNIEEDKET
ncbi:MAG: hypothetical protein BAJALOKI2v1_40074 [Promethearchaeota archaeon]|nr:MAG: hypothetical protein BAJALOKI2v1_40074 [Candidatus Lokiarchaeota archaeon]